MGQGEEISKATASVPHARGLARALAGWRRGGGRAALRPTEAWPLPQTPDFLAMELSLETIDEFRDEWSALAARALEPNPFLERGFALTTARRFSPAERPRFLALRDPRGGLVAVFPLAPSGFSRRAGLLALWRDELTTLGTPLVDRDRAPDILAAFLDWAARASPAGGALFPHIVIGGPFHAALDAAAACRGRRVEILESAASAALLPGGSAEEKCRAAGGRKRVNEIRRQGRRLAEMGGVEVSVRRAPDEVRAAVEEFLALEASGWKARRGAFLSKPALTTFLRGATRLLAAEGLCRIAALRLDGRAVAMAIFLESQNRSYLWKIAYDEDLRAQAPGIQLVQALTALQLARAEVELTDSCAVSGHEMIGALWPERIAIGDVAVSLDDEEFDSALRREKARRRMRDIAKRAVTRLLKRQAGRGGALAFSEGIAIVPAFRKNRTPP